jgi:XapX domain-containing protein
MNWLKIFAGLLLSFAVGYACRRFGIPAASPPVLSGALLVFAMSSGYWLVDRYVARREARNKRHCGGHAIEAPTRQAGGGQ